MSYGGGYGSRGGDYNGYSNGYVFSLHLPTSLCRDFQEFQTVCDHFDCRGCAIVTYFQTLLTNQQVWRRSIQRIRRIQRL